MPLGKTIIIIKRGAGRQHVEVSLLRSWFKHFEKQWLLQL
jgi:hypothetical protein